MKKKIVIFMISACVTISSLCGLVFAETMFGAFYGMALDVGSDVYDGLKPLYSTDSMCGTEILEPYQTRKVNIDTSGYNYETITSFATTSAEYAVFVFFDLDGNIVNFTDSWKQYFYSFSNSGGWERLGVLDELSEALQGGYTNKSAFNPYAEYFISEVSLIDKTYKFTSVFYGYERNYLREETISIGDLYYTNKQDLTNTQMTIFVGEFDEVCILLTNLKENGALTEEELTPLLNHSDNIATILTAPQTTYEKKVENGVAKVSEAWVTSNVNDYGKFSFAINDSGKKHTYGLRISASSVLCGVFEELFVNLQRCEELKASIDEHYGALDLSLDNFFTYFFNIGWNMGSDIGLNMLIDKNQFIEEVYKTSIGDLSGNLNDIVFDKQKMLTDSTLNFENEDLPCLFKTIDIADYINIVANNLYKFEIVDLTTNRVLDYTYIFANRTKNKNDIAFGSNTWFYDDFPTLMNDLSNNNLENANSTEYGGLLQFDNDDVFNSPSDYYDQSFEDVLKGDYNDLTDMVNVAFTGVGDFFQICWSFLPGAYMSIIVASATVLIVLRVMGR